MFIARVMMSTLPVRSPFPNKVPSIRSAPARIPISASATPQPLSLCGCRETNDVLTVFQMITHVLNLARIYMRHGHAVPLLGRLMIAFVVCRGLPYIQNGVAHLQRVLQLGSGEALRTVLETVNCLRVSSASFFRSSAPSTAIFRISSLDLWNTCSRCATRSGIVYMHDGMLRALQALQRSCG